MLGLSLIVIHSNAKMVWFQEDLITRTRLFQKTGASKTSIGELMTSQQFMELTLKDQTLLAHHLDAKLRATPLTLLKTKASTLILLTLETLMPKRMPSGYLNIDQFHPALLSNASKTLCINQIPKVCGLQKTGENKTNTMVLLTSQQFMEPV